MYCKSHKHEYSQNGFFLLFGNVNIENLPPLVIKSGFTYDTIKRVDNTKFLGIFYDDKMSFKFHINYLVQRLSRSSALIYQLREYLPTFVLITLYHAHIGSLLNYCNIIWSCAYETNLLPLVRLLKRVIRNITHSEFLAHTSPLYRETKILNLPSLRNYSLALYFLKYKIYNDNNLHRNHNYLTRHKRNLRLPEHNTRLFRQSFLCKSIEIWNDLLYEPTIDLNNIFSLNIFKKRVKKYLISIL